MRIREIWALVRDFFSHARLEEARLRHERAADKLDQAVKELLKK